MRKVSLVTVLLLTAIGALCYIQYLCQLDIQKYRASFERLITAKATETSQAKTIRRLPDMDTSMLAQIRRDGKVSLPSKDEIDRMQAEAILDTMHSYLGNVDIVCTRMLRMGNLNDGGWEVCDDEQYRPISPCLVYSFGINNDFSFDDYTASNYGCEVFSFDPSMKQKSYKRSPLVQFHNMGVAERDVKPIRSDDWESHTVTSFKGIFGHGLRVLDVLKMDIEGTEWAVLEQLVQSGEASHVRQLLVEFHLWEKSQRGNKLKMLKDLYDLGFRKFYTHKNPFCHLQESKSIPVQQTECYEVHFVNTKISL